MTTKEIVLEINTEQSTGSCLVNKIKTKSQQKKSSPVTSLEWPRGFQEVMVPRLHDKAQDGGKVVTLTHWPPLPPGNTPGIHFC